MNIAVINVKDLFKYILKFFCVILIIILITNGIKGISSLKQNMDITRTIESTTSEMKKNYFLECIDLNLSLLSYKKINKPKPKSIKSTSIISMETEILNAKNLKPKEKTLENEVQTENVVEEIPNQIEELPSIVTTESVAENNIIPKVTDTYNSVKIDNQSDYNITEEMLIPDAEIDNKKDILIYHTHTCESYTPSQRI